MKWLSLILVLVLIVFTVCGCSRITDTVKRGIVTLDTKAESNEEIVNKLCKHPESVTDDEKATAMQNAYIIHFGTSQLRTLVVGDVQASE